MHIYLQSVHPHLSPYWPAIDLSTVRELAGLAERPFVQKAVALPFWSQTVKHTAFGMVSVDVRNTYRWPSAIIKVGFGADELLAMRPDLTAERLFPTGEQLYRHLLAARAPELAVYQ